MKISSVLNIYNIPQAQKPVFTNRLTNDVFERRVSFGCEPKDNSYSSFEKWAEESGFLTKVDEIFDDPANEIGSGFEGTTFTIPGNDMWVIKQDKCARFLHFKTDKPKITEIEDVLPDINIGQAIAYVTMPVSECTSRRFYILKKQQGTEYGVSYDLKSFLYESNIKRHIESLKALSQFPLESYKQLVREVVTANNAGFVFDYYNPNNFLLDMKNKKINCVDVSRDNPEFKSQLPEVIFGLLGGDFSTNFMRHSNNEMKKFEARRYAYEIIDKYETAVFELGYKLDKNNGYKRMIENLLS